MKRKGIVVKAKDSQCIILTKDGTYVKVPASRVRNTRVGAETEFSSAEWMSQLRPLLMVASILIFVLGFGMYRMTGTPAAAAYVSLDINPSIELAVDDQTKVIGTHAINSDAETLLDGMQLKGKDLYTSLREIVDKAAANGYIKPNQTNYVLSSVTLEKSGSNVVNYDNILNNLRESVSKKELDVEFVIVSADKATRNEAKSEGLSAGKMMVYKSSVNSGEKLTLSQVKQNSLTNLVNIYKVKVLPNNKKAIVKLLHVPPYSQRFKHKTLVPDGNQTTENDVLSTSGDDSSREVLDKRQNKKDNKKAGHKGNDLEDQDNNVNNSDTTKAAAPGLKEKKQTGPNGKNQNASQTNRPDSNEKNQSGQNKDNGKDSEKTNKADVRESDKKQKKGNPDN